MQVFYVNIGGGEPTVRPDFWELVDYATAHHVGVKFSTNGVRITPEVAARLAASDYVDVQISLDGATAEVNDAVRGDGLVRDGDPGAGEPRRGGLQRRQDLGRRDPPQRRPARRLRGAGRALRCHAAHHPAASRPAAAPTCGTSCTRPPEQQVQLYDWLVARGDGVLTGDSFFHLSGLGAAGCAGRPEPVRRGPGGLPDRPGRRRLRLPVRHPRPVPGRKHPVRRRFRQRLEERSAVPRAAGAAVGRRVRQLRTLRQLPRRLHGREVLHRPAAGRSRPRMR